MTDLAPLPDPNAVMMALLQSAAPDVDPESDEAWYVGTAYPDELEQRSAPTLLVGHLGGPTDETGARPAIDVTVIAPTYTAAQGTIEIIEPAVMGARFAVLEGGWKIVIDRVEGQGFYEVEWDDTRLRRFMGTFTLTIRRGGTTKP